MASSTYPVFFESAFLGTSNATIYTVGGTATTILRGLWLKLTNVTAATRLVTIYASEDGNQDSSNAVLFEHPVPPNDWITVPISRISKDGVIEGFCDAANAVNVSQYEDTGRLFTP